MVCHSSTPRKSRVCLLAMSSHSAYDSPSSASLLASFVDGSIAGSIKSIVVSGVQRAFEGLVADLPALFPTAHLANKSLQWTDAYFAQDPEVQRQLKQYRLRVDRNSEFTSTKKMKSGNQLPISTWVGEGFCGSVTPSCGVSLSSLD